MERQVILKMLQFANKTSGFHETVFFASRVSRRGYTRGFSTVLCSPLCYGWGWELGRYIILIPMNGSWRRDGVGVAFALILFSEVSVCGGSRLFSSLAEGGRGSLLCATKARWQTNAHSAHSVFAHKRWIFFGRVGGK